MSTEPALQPHEEPGHTPEGAAGRTGRRWLGWLAALALVIMVGALCWSAVHSNGEFAYPLDDPYIHLRLAENLSSDSVLGINEGEFASAGSSLAWPVILAVPARLLGPLVGIPLAMSTAVGALTMVILDRWASRRGLRFTLRIAFLIALIFVVPLLLMSLIGMEHVLQVLLAFLLIDCVVDTLLSDRPAAPARLWAIGLLGAGLAAVRLEALFVVAVLGLMLLWRRQLRAALVLGAGSAIPLVVMVAINLGQGWPALPASVMSKGITGSNGFDRFLPHPQTATLLRTPRLVMAVTLVALLLVLGQRLKQRFDRRALLWGIAVLGIFAVHLCFGMFGWLYRYEAYLVAICLGAAALAGESLLRNRRELVISPPWRVLTGSALTLIVLLSVFDGLRVNGVALTGMREIRQQQLEMARFTASACPGCRVVVNDIGVLSLYGDVDVVDSTGLANREVVEARLDGTYDAAFLSRLAAQEGAQMGAVYAYSPWIPGVPDSWVKIGEWRFPSNEVVGGSVVTFFAIDADLAPQLRRAFEQWDSHGFFVAVPAEG